MEIAEKNIKKAGMLKYVTLHNQNLKKSRKLPFIRMQKVEPGTYMKGSPTSEVGRYADEHQEEVTIENGFEMSTYPITQKQWTEVMGENPSYFIKDSAVAIDKQLDNTENHPVECVNWYDCIIFCNALSKKHGLHPVYYVGEEPIGKDTKIEDFENIEIRHMPDNELNGYRIPTDDEWEYACRAGSTGAIYDIKDPQTGEKREGKATEVAWTAQNSEGTTKEVGLKEPNAWGLYDMLGNVYEWTE